ncbi:processing of precursor 5, ribonuclease P/MRP subunit (S. cerevisiae), isoform CRA_c [Homo sapiens]|nr:processing of precursor 5, ribonuclease P/MRP subunit (S. cerevisiae), isoform CRA_c [Homo sapiens]
MVRFKHRYLLCELVSDDPRCRLSLDDRVLSSLVRDTIARVHGTFGAAACSIGFAGARALGEEGNPGGWRDVEGAGAGGRKKGHEWPSPCTVFCKFDISMPILE